MSFAPGWQTDELQDEWIELEPDETTEIEIENHNNTRSISFTVPLPAQIITSSDINVSRSTAPPGALGTFLVREDVQNAPLLPKTPHSNRKGMKDIFTPLPLETMFEPPTPPERKTSTSSARPLAAAPHGSQEDIQENYVPNISSFQRREPSAEYKFTFSMPWEISTRQNHLTDGVLNQVQTTPNPPLTPHAPPPATDPRLRLFQFQYDTYTRDHLSAMVDSIAVNTPSGSVTGTTPSPTNGNPILSRVSEVSTVNTSHLRSAKRVKLSPRTDFYGEGDGAGASISRPRPTGRDYVGESRTLMQKIKQARDFSTISTVASARRGSPNSSDHGDEANHAEAPASADASRRPSSLQVPSHDETIPPSSSSTVKSEASSSNKYRQQAAQLMAQIRNDMKGQKRLFSNETISSKEPNAGEGKNSSQRRTGLGSSSSRPPTSLGSSSSSRTASLRGSRSRSVSGTQHVTDGMFRMSVQDNAARPDAPVLATSLSRPPIQQRGGTAPSFPLSSIRNGTTEDLNRFVSSSTASGATITAGSVPSFVKHPGPAQMRTIAPADIPELPDRLGEMVFDKMTMKWIRSGSREVNRGAEVGSATEASDDPFGDIESLRDEVGNTSQEIEPPHEVADDGAAVMSRIEEQEEQEVDAEEMELTSFSTDASMHVVQVMTGVKGDDYGGEQDHSTDLEEGEAQTEEADANATKLESDVGSHDQQFETDAHAPPRQETMQAPPPIISTATPSRPNQSPLPNTCSAMKSSSVTPASVLKSANNKFQTPLHKRRRRSVSFSDGKRDGPIRGLSTPRTEAPSADVIMLPMSARSKRIAEMMNALQDSDSENDASDSPSRSNSLDRPEDMCPLTERVSTEFAEGNVSGSRVFSKSYASQSSSRQAGSGTFLTECSFAVTHDRLVQVITDVQPSEPYWEELSSIDLSNKRLESVTRLKEFLPQLDVLNLNTNRLSWLSGVPVTVRTLSVAFNCLTELTSYSHLANLEHLDISRNEVESLRQLACLRHLHELKADGNKITSLEGLDRMDGLVKLSVQGNLISSINCKQFKWTRMEMLNMSDNRLDNVRGLASLQSLVALNMDNNQVEKLDADGSMPKLRILRISGNKMQELNAGSFPNLRTLYADNNALVNLIKLERLSKVENLSLRSQRGRGLNVLTRDVRDAKRLYLSGNAIKRGFFDEHCYNLVYLELARCRLTALPEEMALLVPNLRVLNLNYNFLEDVRALEGLTRLRKLTIVGSRLKGTKGVIRLVQRMREAEELDFRMNPCTLGWYLPVVVRDGGVWEEQDRQFRRDLPDETYIGRLAYRGLVMRACPKVRKLDGVEMSEKERRKAQKVLAGILGRRGDGI
ncbi:hypothetical protein APHAL10511_008305 [Amanita phalloides]|nr:hypothetical protein APHAL10511_008305 [Amanita phalloides]